MKTTVGQLRNSQQSLNDLLSAEMKVSTAYKISKIVNDVSQEVEESEKFRTQLVERYGKKNEEDGVTYVPEENREDFTKELQELFEQEVELDHKPIAVDELKRSDGSEIDIDSRTLLTLDWLLE